MLCSKQNQRSFIGNRQYVCCFFYNTLDKTLKGCRYSMVIHWPIYKCITIITVCYYVNENALCDKSLDVIVARFGE